MLSGTPARLQEVVAVGAQSAQELVDALGIELPAAGVEGAILLPAQIRDQAAERRQAGDKSRNQVTLQPSMSAISAMWQEVPPPPQTK